jgi:NAD-dependent deacetylase
MNENLKEGIEQTAKEILHSKHVVASTGAGVSTESGIPDFRGPGGIWTKLGKGDLSGMTSMFKKIREVKPNPGHYALAELEEMDVLKCLITQNVDNLHRVAGSKNVIEFHGNMYKSRCTKCNARFDSSHREEIKAHKQKCGGRIRNDTVMFGDPIPPDALQSAFDEARRCDCMIVAGTSAVVYPAADLPYRAKASGARIIEVNAEETQLTHSISDHFLKGKTGEILSSLVDEIKRLS